MDGADGVSEEVRGSTTHQDRTELHLPVWEKTWQSLVRQRTVKAWSS